MDKKPRLIDAVALVKCITKMPFEDMTSDQLRMVCRIHDVINDAHTIEAEPVRHGRWALIEGFWACSECGASPADWEAKPDNPMGLPPYCHSCGAKMDAKEEDHE